MLKPNDARSPAAPHIAYVFMKYPVASETFAQRDVLALERYGCRVQKLSVLDGWTLRNLKSMVRAISFGRPGFFAVFKLALNILLSSGWVWREKLKCLVLLLPAARVAAVLVESRPDVVHLFWGHYPSLVTLLSRKYLPDARYSFFLGAYDLEKELPVSRWAADCSEVIFTHAHVNRPQIRALIGERAIQVIHRGIDLQGYEDVPSFASRGNVIFTAGRLIPDKGFDRALEAFVGIKRRFPDAQLRIAGDGPDRQRLQALSNELGVSGNVEFLGWLSEQQVREQLFQARTFILLSTKRGERLPNVVKEAMAAGCISITTPSPGIDELVRHASDGFVVSANAVQDIAQAVAFSFTSAEAESMSARAMMKVKNGFDVRHAANSYLQAWSGPRGTADVE